LARSLAGRRVADPENPDVTWTYALEAQGLSIRRADDESTEKMLIDYAFGSGHHAMTFVSMVDAALHQPRALEHRLTLFTADGSLGITPGQVEGGNHAGQPRGYKLSAEETLKCFRCHATRVSAGDESVLNLATMIPNVSCERCHGPGRAHIEAARRGQEDLPMPLGAGRWNAEEMLSFCGRCHRDSANSPPGFIKPNNRQIVRFQPVGLKQSRCFRESKGTLSCVTCHDPHARTTSDRAEYEAACLSCHKAAPQSVCSLSPQNGCIGCHMPAVDSGQGVLFTDHWVRVRRDTGGRSPSPAKARIKRALSIAGL
jgi:hypothetical protein